MDSMRHLRPLVRPLAETRLLNNTHRSTKCASRFLGRAIHGWAVFLRAANYVSERAMSRCWYHTATDPGVGILGEFGWRRAIDLGNSWRSVLHQNVDNLRRGGYKVIRHIDVSDQLEPRVGGRPRVRIVCSSGRSL
jgi:hypothetical protein